MTTTRRRRVFWFLVAAGWFLGASPQAARSAAVGVGDLVPSVAQWDATKSCYVGQSGVGSLTVDGDSGLASHSVYIGTYDQAVGDVVMTGPGATWHCVTNFELGTYGRAAMTVADGAAITVEGTTFVATQTGSSGSLHFDSAGSLTTKTFAGNPRDLSGSGTIHTRGLIADVNVVFDSPASLHQTIVLDDLPGQNVTIDLDMSVPANNGWLGAGYRGFGTTTITGTANVTSNGEVHIGYREGSHGTVNVDGSQAVWTRVDATAFGTAIGYHGEGYLNILNGGQVVGGKDYTVGYGLGGYGQVTVSGSGSKWNNVTNLMIARAGDGAVNILDGGELTVANSCNIGFNIGAGSLTVGGDGSRFIANSGVYLGYLGGARGSLRVLDGGYAESKGCIVTCFAGSGGEVIVRGSGSTWANLGDLAVGRSGPGRMTIADGGVVTSQTATVGYESSGDGQTLVCGPGSRWTNSGSLQIGGVSGQGSLFLAHGGQASATSVSVKNAQSLLSVVVGDDARLTVNGGAGTLTNNGTVRLIADADATPYDSHTPILAGSWLGTGQFEFLGGTAFGHSLIVSPVTQGDSGVPIDVNLASVQRIQIDHASGWTLGASFRAADDSAPLAVTASAVVGSTLADLREHMYLAEAVLGGWTFDTSGAYASGDPAYLSFLVGDGFARDELQLWRYTGDDWAKFDAPDFVYDGAYASFTAEELEGFAVTTILGDLLPGDANGDNKVDDADAAILAAHWLTRTDATWKMGDFNDDGAVDDRDAAILAAHWVRSTSHLPGDANGDHVVNDDDAAAMAAHWLTRSGATWAMGDFNDDGAVDDRDAAILAAHWVRSGESADVPEPSTLALVASALAAFALRRRRR